MADQKITQFTEATSFSADTDLIPIVINTGTTPANRKMTKGNLQSELVPYTSLVQLLNQTSTNAPVATEVYNNTGETFTWSYVSAGIYRITGTGTPFTANKTVVFVNNGNANDLISSNVSWWRVSDTVIEIRPSSDDWVVDGSFEVKIYN